MTNTIKDLKEIAEEVKHYFPELTAYEAARIAVQHQSNCIQMTAHMISAADLYPGALEAIAMQLSHISGVPIK